MSTQPYLIGVDVRKHLMLVGVAAALGASVLVPVPGAASEPLATTVDVGVDSVGDVTKALDEVLDEAPAAIKELVANTADLLIPLGGAMTSRSINASLIRGTPAIKIGAGPWVYVGAAVAGCLSRYVR